MRVAALDISKNCTGWAIDGDDGLPRAGSWKGAHGKEPGSAGRAYSQWLCLMIPVWKPDLIAIEAPLVGAGGDFLKNYTLLGLAFLTETIASSYKLPCRRGNVKTVRQYFIGSNPPDPKPAVMKQCQVLGWAAENYDESDALAVWAWAKSFDKSWRLETATPLFAHRTGAAR